MDLGRPGSIIMAPGMHAVLMTLAGTDKNLTGRQVALLADLSQNGSHKLLTRLTEHGLVQAEPAGRAVLYRLNRRHLLVDPLLEIIRAQRRLVDRLTDAVAAWDIAPLHVGLFGSATRGDGNLESDLDLFVVREDDVDADETGWRDQLDRTTQDAFEWTGNRLAYLEFDRSEIASAVRRGERIIDEWRADAIRLYGLPLADVLTDRPKA